MATIKLVENPTRRKAANPSRKRRNTTAAKLRTRRNTTKTATVRNPSPIARKVSNPRKKTRRRQRNGVTVKTKRRNGVIAKRRNGLFGDTKATVKAVGALLGGLLATNFIGGVAAPIVARPLAAVGLGAYAKPSIEVASAVTVNRWLGQMVAGPEGAKFAMIGGLAMAVASLVQQMLPQASTFNPFATPNAFPVIVNQPVVGANTAAQIAAANRSAVGMAVQNPRRPFNVARPRF